MKMGGVNTSETSVSLTYMHAHLIAMKIERTNFGYGAMMLYEATKSGTVKNFMGREQ